MSSFETRLTAPLGGAKITNWILGPIIYLNRKFGLKFRLDYFRKYLAEFGPLDAFNVYRKLNSASGSDAHLELTVRDITFPVTLRRGTADSSTFDSVFIWKQYDIRLPDDSKNVFDCGANIGLASVWFANVCPGARIVALEPQRDNYELLKRNCQHYPAVSIHQAALWNKVGELNLSDSTVRVDSYQYTEGDGDSSEHVAAFDIPSLMALHKISTIDVLKIDVEGAETVIFDESCQSWLDNVRLLIIELHNQEARTMFEAAVSRSSFSWQHTIHGENDVILRGSLRSFSD